MTLKSFLDRSATIKSLGVAEAGLKQSMLVALLADIVNHETCDGEDTCPNTGVQGQDYWSCLKSILRDNGFMFLGAGHFSAAFEHECMPGRVIKVGFKKEDSGAAYAAFCRMNQGREGIPTVYDIQRHTACYTVVLDRLDHINAHRYREESNIEEQYELAEDSLFNRGCIESWDVQSYELARTAADIRKFFYGIASFDLHDDNIMVHPQTGNLVITDPVSFSCDEALSDDKFHCDPEELLTEIEAHRASMAIERCRERKAKRDPQGTFRLHLKARIKNRRKWAKVRARQHRQQVANRQQDFSNRRKCEAVKMVYGEPHFDNLMWQGGFKVIAEEAERIRMNDRWAVAKGLPLAVDKELDARFMG